MKTKVTSIWLNETPGGGNVRFIRHTTSGRYIHGSTFQRKDITLASLKRLEIILRTADKPLPVLLPSADMTGFYWHRPEVS